MMDSRQEDIRRSALDYLASHRVMTLATAGIDGPWAAAVFYANRGFDLYFLSADSTRHIQEISENPNVAATIQEDYRDWPDIKGIQMEGIVQRLSGQDKSQAVSLYGQKYPFIISAGAQIRSALKRVSWFRLTPYRLYFVDNSRGFGHRDSVELDE
ncbi:MAG: pyridoxamine 5'-phosphate oxidase family protein [Candidatus Promineifilaceae bacterium]|jgi:uncharacterized protein